MFFPVHQVFLELSLQHCALCFSLQLSSLLFRRGRVLPLSPHLFAAASLIAALGCSLISELESEQKKKAEGGGFLDILGLLNFFFSQYWRPNLGPCAC